MGTQMPQQKPQPNAQQTSPSGRALRFAAGAGMGALITLVPFSAGFAPESGPVSIIFAAVVVVASGLLSSLWGDRFLDAVSRALDSTPV